MDVDSVDIVRLRPDDPERESLIRGALIVKNAGWRDTYSGWLSSDYLDAQAARLDADVASWSRALADGRLLPTWVAVAGGAVPSAGAGFGEAMPDGEGLGPARVVGVAAAHPVDEPHDRGGLGGGTDGADVEQELGVLYVDARWRGSEVATRLADAAIGDASACLWVLEDNPRAQGFYRKIGFEPDGAVEDLPADWNGAREIRMVRR
jgi:ribosomal protein S18 acetylase RimI-like enzyme